MKRSGSFFVLAFAFVTNAALADVVRVHVADANSNAIVADVCLYDPATGEIIHGTTNAGSGNHQFSVNQMGQYDVVASSAGFVGRVVNAIDSHPNAGQFTDITLQSGAPLNGPICSPSLSVTSFTLNNKNPQTFADTIPIQFSTSVVFGKAIEFCVAETASEINACRAGSAPWTAPDRIRESRTTAFSAYATLKRYRDLSLTLLVRFQDLSQVSGPAVAQIRRPGPPDLAIMTGSFVINDGATATAQNNVQLSWAAIVPDSRLKISYCTRQLPPPGQPAARCQSQQFQNISPDAINNQLAVFTAPATLSGQKGMKTLALEIQYADYPDVNAGPASDGIILSDDLVAEFPCFANALGEEVEISNEGGQNVFEYSVNGDEILVFASQNGWEFSGSTSSANTSCTVGLTANETGDFDLLPADGMLLLSEVHPSQFIPLLPFPALNTGNCNFRLFEGRNLNPGWSFESLQLSKELGPDINSNGVVDEDENLIWPDCSTTVTMPSRGGSSLATRVTSSWPSSQFLSTLNCSSVVTEVRLRGPACANWRDALVAPAPP